MKSSTGQNEREVGEEEGGVGDAEEEGENNGERDGEEGDEGHLLE